LTRETERLKKPTKQKTPQQPTKLSNLAFDPFLLDGFSVFHINLSYEKS